MVIVAPLALSVILEAALKDTVAPFIFMVPPTAYFAGPPNTSTRLPFATTDLVPRSR